jgi:hypothetical protein
MSLALVFVNSTTAKLDDYLRWILNDIRRQRSISGVAKETVDFPIQVDEAIEFALQYEQPLYKRALILLYYFHSMRERENLPKHEQDFITATCNPQFAFLEGRQLFTGQPYGPGDSLLDADILAFTNHMCQLYRESFRYAYVEQKPIVFLPAAPYLPQCAR